MTSVTMTIAKKKPIEAAVGLPSVVSMAGAAAGAACASTSCVRAPNMSRSPCAGKSVEEAGLALQLALEALDLGVVGLVRPRDVERGEHPREHDRRDAERDRERRHLADL